MNRVALRVSFALLVLSLSPAALASEPFPDIIKDQLMLPCDKPICTLCHQTLLGGLMTVSKPFGRNLREKYGLTLLNVAGLRSAIMQAQANGDDSDGDRVGDIAELLQCTDPNVPEGGIAVDEPRFGCYCSAVPAPRPSAAAGAVWLTALGLSGLRRRAVRRLREERKP
jgi:hypothetical protein